MTVEEAALLVARRPDIQNRLSSHDNPQFVNLVAQPCPLLDLDTNRCTVYDIRPYNCRRYQCHREPGEPFTDGFPVRVLTQRPAKRQYVLNERHAMRWARKNGWQD